MPRIGKRQRRWMNDHPALLLLPDINERVLRTFSKWNEEMNIAELNGEFP
jgi:hypothetical protein